MRTQVFVLPIFLVIYSGFLTPLTKSANILAIVPYGGKSHFIVIEPLLKGLAQKGHNVTVVSSFPLKKPVPNYVDIDVSRILPGFAGTFTVDFIKENFGSSAQACKVIWGMGYNLCEHMFKNIIFENLLNSTFKYDLLITEIFSTDCFLAFAHKWDIPVVSITTSVALPWTNDRVGNPDNPSYIPNYFTGYGDQMAFFERLSNTIELFYTKLFNYYNADKPHHEIIKKYFGDNLPPLEEIARQRTSLVLVNSYLSVNQPRPLVPNVIEIGGIHLQQTEPLPQEIKTILDKATNGFILFSLGSLLKSSSMDQNKIDAFVRAFSKLPQLVLWKYEEDELPNRPANVITRRWWPQKDILGHKNIKVFITHGGLSSTLEVVNAGVPMLGIPMFADQSGNVNNIVRRGAALKLNYDDITSETLYDALTKLTNDKSYMEKAKEISRQFKDRPLSALDNAVFWIEYVLRHKGAYHLHSASADLPLYQYLLLDVIAFILFVSFTTVFIIYRAAKIFVCFFFSRNKDNVKYSKNKKLQ